MAAWTSDKVLSLAPDAASASAGQSLATARKWSNLGASERAVWGMCQGSGKEPYQTRIDLGEPAFKCSCPSRKFPCKHGIALLLMFSKDEKSFRKDAEPGWVSDWLATRAEKAEKKTEKAKAEREKPVDEAAQAKRAAKREERVMGGVAECRTWLDDLVRRGLAAAKGDSPAEWERVAARMVDAQAPGLAGFVRRVAALLNSGEGWDVRTLDVLGRLHLVLEAATKLDALPAELAVDVRTVLGYPQSKDDVLAGEGVADCWCVLGQVFEEEERLIARRTWLRGQRSGAWASILEFAPLAGPGAKFDTSLIPGTAFEGELAYYPSRQPLRALVKSGGDAPAPPTDPRAESIALSLRAYAEGLGKNPWLLHWPMMIDRARIQRCNSGWVMSDGRGDVLPVRSHGGGMSVWKLLSVSGGHDARVFVEWDGESATLVSVMTSDGLCDLLSRWAA